MGQKPTPKPPPPFVENLQAPELFASLAPFFSIANGVVTITLASLRWDNAVSPGEQKLVAVARVTMPIAGASGLAIGLHTFLEKSGVHAITPAEREHMQ